MEEKGTSRVAGDLRLGGGGKGDVAPAIAGGQHGGESLRALAQLTAHLLQGGFGSVLGLGSGAHHGGGQDLPLLIENDHIGGGGAAVDAGVQGAGRFGGGTHRRSLDRLKVQALHKGLQPGGQLPCGLGGEVGLQLDHGQGESFLQLGVLKAVVVTELYRVVDDPLQPRVLGEGLASGQVRHAQAGGHGQQRPGVPLHEIFKGDGFRIFGQGWEGSVARAGEVRYWKGQPAPDEGEQRRAHPGAQNRQEGTLGQRGGVGLGAGGQKDLPLESHAGVGAVLPRQADQLIPQTGFGAGSILVGQVQQPQVPVTAPAL